MRGTFAILAALLIGSSLLADGLSFSLSKKAIAFGERTRVEYHLPISALGLAKYDDESELPILNDDLVMDSKHLIVLERDFRREKDTLIWRFDITSYEKGKLIVPPVEIKFGPHTFSSEAVPLEVLSTRKAEDKELRPDFGTAKHPVDWAFWSKLLALGLAALTLYLWAKKKRLWPRFLAFRRRLTPPVPEEPAESWLRRELNRIKLRRQNQTENSLPLVDDLTRVLRGFFRRKTKTPAESFTTRELKVRLPQGSFPAEVEPLLKEADLWKFGQEKSLDEQTLVDSGIQTSERTLL